MRKFINGMSTLGVIAALLSLSACKIGTSADLCVGIDCAPDVTTQVPEVVHPVPVLTEVVAVNELVIDLLQADYEFNTTEAGTINYSGDCISTETEALQGDNVITFDLEWDKQYNNCQITVTTAENQTSSPLDISSFTVLKTTTLNDTGITACGDYGFDSGIWNNNVNCEIADVSNTGEGYDDQGDVVPAGQDALQGRDANLALIKVGSGEQGFDFTQQSSNGWNCLHDNVTGMTWLINQNPDDTYTWYHEGSGVANGSATTCAGYSSGDASSYCNTEAYTVRVNAQQACGYSDWRMPKREELQSIVHKGKVAPPTIDSIFTDTPIDPSTVDIFYWTSSKVLTSTGDNGYSFVINFKDGSDDKLIRSYDYRVRLVRGNFLADESKPDYIYKDNQNGTVSDLKTGLMWQKCSVGKSGSGCDVGTLRTFNWKTAAEEMLIINNGGFAGHADWRLPSVNELYSLVDDSRELPSINQNYFPQTDAVKYWTSSPGLYKADTGSAVYTMTAWTISFDDGTASRSDKTVSFPIRLVRDIN